jgi:hypothetical protein
MDYSIVVERTPRATSLGPATRNVVVIDNRNRRVVHVSRLNAGSFDPEGEETMALLCQLQRERPRLFAAEDDIRFAVDDYKIVPHKTREAPRLGDAWLTSGTAQS